MKKRFGALLALACVCLLTTNCALQAAGPAQTIKKFYGYLEAGKVDDAVNLLSARVLNVLSRDKLKSGLADGTRQVKSKGGIKSIDIAKEEVVGETADVQSKVNFGNGESKTDKSKLIKENGEWKIDLSK